MQVSVTEAKGLLTQLVRRAEAGDRVVLTRHGHPAVRLVPVVRLANLEAGRAVIKVARADAAKAANGPGAARRQDSPYADSGLPQ